MGKGVSRRPRPLKTKIKDILSELIFLFLEQNLKIKFHLISLKPMYLIYLILLYGQSDIIHQH